MNRRSSAGGSRPKSSPLARRRERRPRQTGSADHPFLGSAPRYRRRRADRAVAEGRGHSRPAIQPRTASAGGAPHRRAAPAGARSRTCCRMSPARSASADGHQPGGLWLQGGSSISGRSTSSTPASALSQPLVDLRAFNDYRAAALNERAEARRHQVRTRPRRAGRRQPLSGGGHRRQPDRRRARAAADAAALCRRPRPQDVGTGGRHGRPARTGQVQNLRQRRVAAENDSAKAKLRLARAIGLPPGQRFTLADKIPFAPLAEVTLEDALARAYEQRADYLASRDCLAAAESTRAPPTPNCCRPCTSTPTTAPSARRADAHPTYAVGAIVRVPLFEAGKAQAKRAEGGALRQRRAGARGRARPIDLEVPIALLDVTAASQQLEAADATVALANQELEQAATASAAGVASNIEVTEAQEVAGRAGICLAVLYAHNLAKASLARAAGIAEPPSSHTRRNAVMADDNSPRAAGPLDRARGDADRGHRRRVGWAAAGKESDRRRPDGRPHHPAGDAGRRDGDQGRGRRQPARRSRTVAGRSRSARLSGGGRRGRAELAEAEADALAAGTGVPIADGVHAQRRADHRRRRRSAGRHRGRRAARSNRRRRNSSPPRRGCASARRRRPRRRATSSGSSRWSRRKRSRSSSTTRRSRRRTPARGRRCRQGGVAAAERHPAPRARQCRRAPRRPGRRPALQTAGRRRSRSRRRAPGRRRPRRACKQVSGRWRRPSSIWNAPRSRRRPPAWSAARPSKSARSCNRASR